jgi:hypothetical protein
MKFKAHSSRIDMRIPMSYGEERGIVLDNQAGKIPPGMADYSFGFA